MAKFGMWNLASAAAIAAVLAGCGAPAVPTAPLPDATERRANFKKKAPVGSVTPAAMPATGAAATAKPADKARATATRPGGSAAAPTAPGGATAPGEVIASGEATGPGEAPATEAPPAGRPVGTQAGLPAVEAIAGVTILEAPTGGARMFPRWEALLAPYRVSALPATEAAPAPEADELDVDPPFGDPARDGEDAEGEPGAEPVMITGGMAPEEEALLPLVPADEATFAPADGTLTWRIEAPPEGLRIATVQAVTTGGRFPLTRTASPASFGLPAELRGEMALRLPFALEDLTAMLATAREATRLEVTYTFYAEDGRPILAHDGKPLTLASPIAVE